MGWVWGPKGDTCLWDPKGQPQREDCWEFSSGVNPRSPARWPPELGDESVSLTFKKAQLRHDGEARLLTLDMGWH